MLIAGLLCACLFVIHCHGQNEPNLPLTGTGQGLNPRSRASWMTDSTYECLYRYGDWNNDKTYFDLDQQLGAEHLNGGRTIDLKMRFPFYGGRYNYTTISVHGYIAFANVVFKGLDFPVGPSEVKDWPNEADPAMMAPYMCGQKLSPEKSGSGKDRKRPGVFYRLVLREDIAGNKDKSERAAKYSHVKSGPEFDDFLDGLMQDLQDGMVGATTFEAAAALVVTWADVVPSTSSASSANKESSTYQLVWMTNRDGTLSYVIINYAKLGFSAADVNNNGRMGRCKALFNGGNHTGIVLVDPSDKYKDDPSSLAARSAVPHRVQGRHMFRVDDVVRRGGCSNKTGGTYPLMIYPNIVNMLGETTVDINAMCLTEDKLYTLQISQRESANCVRLNSAIARCTLPPVMMWGTLDVFFQPESGGTADEKAYKGYIYFVPPTFDPMMLMVSDYEGWFQNPPSTKHTIKWYPGNFTDPTETDYPPPAQQTRGGRRIQLELVLYGYTEDKDERAKKFIPRTVELAVLASNIQNYQSNSGDIRRGEIRPSKYDLNIESLQNLQINKRENIHKFRFGYLKLMPKPPATGPEARKGQYSQGLVSSLIPLHWLWKLDQDNHLDGIKEYVKERADQMCLDWYEEDGTQWNFIQDTETNASCPCKVEQAKMDLGRFMPHPRCSEYFRDMQCTVNMGSATCFMSAQNVYYSAYPGFSRTSSKEKTQYGQVCCYNPKGYLMHTHYQPVVKTTDDYPYSPGFPQRAFELGTDPFRSQFQVPGMSSFQYDTMPYFFCCKWADNRCQLFYWRRPTSGCQEYRSPNLGRVVGAGHFVTLDGWKYTFDEPGVFTLLDVPEARQGRHRIDHDSVKIQVRLEAYPDRTVDFGSQWTRQERLVQPLNVTVVTGIAMQAGDSDVVQVALRKDTRRFKYRTSIMVGGVLRYFDTMLLQRYKGVLVYVNAVNKGLSEVYVVLEKAGIGVRIKESFAMDMDREQAYRESPGMLDLMVSVSPEYGIPFDNRQQQANTLSPDESSDVGGLLRPFPNRSPPHGQQMHTVDEGMRRDLINKYQIQGTGTLEVDISKEQQQNLFTASDEFKVWPGRALIQNNVYQSSSDIRENYIMKTDQDVTDHINKCDDIGVRQKWEQPDRPLGILSSYSHENWKCVTDKNVIDRECGSDKACRYDYALLYQGKIATNTKDALEVFYKESDDSMKHYNSCGAINIEYPEYLYLSDALGPKYLDSHTARFECYQSHWLKRAQDAYVCDFRGWQDGRPVYGWNQGWQPWCRSRTKERTFKWLAGVAGLLLIIAIIGAIFIGCWFMKRNRIHQRDEERKKSHPVSKTFQPELGPPDSQKIRIPVLDQEPRNGAMKPSYPPVTVATKPPSPHRPRVVRDSPSLPPKYPISSDSNRSSLKSRSSSNQVVKELDTAV